MLAIKYNVVYVIYRFNNKLNNVNSAKNILMLLTLPVHQGFLPSVEFDDHLIFAWLIYVIQGDFFVVHDVPLLNLVSVKSVGHKKMYVRCYLVKILLILEVI